MGVAELWRFDGQRLEILQRTADGQYRIANQSLDIDLPLPDGITAMHGPPGAGKSMRSRSHNSPVWIRSSFGQSFGDRTNPFANFYFGGFGNNWVDHLDTSRYREYYSLAGVPLDQVNGPPGAVEGKPT